MSGTAAGGPVDVFVSYAGPDQQWAEWAAWQLEEAGYSVELDVWDWAAGENVLLRMSDALDRARVVLALWSPEYFQQSRLTTAEWTAVMARPGQRRLVPVRLTAVDPPPILRSLLWRDLFGMDKPRAKEELLAAVGGPRRPLAEPGFPGAAGGRVGDRQRPQVEPEFPGGATRPAIQRHILLLVGCAIFAFMGVAYVVFHLRPYRQPPPLLATLTGHARGVVGVAFSPDRTTLASCSSDSSIRLWDVTTQRTTATLLGHDSGVYSVAFTPDGKTLASAGHDNTVRLWDLATKQSTATLTGHTSPVRSVVFSPGGKTLASASFNNAIRLWDVTDPVHPTPLSQPRTAETSGIYSIVFRPDGKTLASANGDGTIRLWSLATKQTTATLSGHTGAVYTVAFSPDRKIFASGGIDGLVRLWEVADPAHPKVLGQPLTGHTSRIYSVAFSPDGKTLASASGDGTIRLWSLATKQTTATLTGQAEAVQSVAFSPDGKTLASAGTDKSVRLWRVD
jgi:TIR domain/WD domain, G-beta repeat